MNRQITKTQHQRKKKIKATKKCNDQDNEV